MSILDFNWAGIGGMLTVFGIIFSVVFLVMQARLTKAFVTRGEHEGVIERVRGIENSLTSLPKSVDILALERRLGEMGERVAGLGPTIQGVKDDTVATRSLLTLLIDAQLKAEKKE